MSKIPFQSINRVNKSHPLLCWDICSDITLTRKMFANDIKKLNALRIKNKWSDMVFSLEHQLVWERNIIVITDKNLQIKFASQNIFDMTGYSPKEIIGNKPNIFQGEDTSKEIRDYISTAIKKQQPFKAVVVNYKKNGAKYNCQIEGYPLFDAKGNLVNYIALEKAA